VTQTREGLIEAMARAIREMRDRPHSSYADEARAALAVLEAHAAVVPREPTREMQRAAIQWTDAEAAATPDALADCCADFCEEWRRVLSASPFAPEKETRDE